MIGSLHSITKVCMAGRETVAVSVYRNWRIPVKSFVAGKGAVQTDKFPQVILHRQWCSGSKKKLNGS